MKFTDIPQFTGFGHYQINVSWQHLKDEINHFVDEYGLELNPDFQRGHIWTKKQKIAYVEYKLAGGPGANLILFNCVGWMNDFRGPFVLVDGLQRVTAVLDFLNGKIPAYGYLIGDYCQPLYRIKSDFLFNVNDLKTRNEVLVWYLQINSGGTPHSKKEIEKVKNLIS